MAKLLTPNEEEWIGFNELPHPSERAKMSPERLAVLLSECKIGEPPYILVEHELNLRIAKEQSGATWKAAGLGFLGALLAAVLGAWSTGAFQPQKTHNCVCEWHPSDLRPQENLGVKPPTVIEPEPVGKPIKPPAASGPPVQPAQTSNAASNKNR